VLATFGTAVEGPGPRGDRLYESPGANQR
jgi:hypothetical protein